MATQAFDRDTGEFFEPARTEPAGAGSPGLLDDIIARAPRYEVRSPAEIAAIMAQKDEAAILAAAEGVATDEWFYEFRMGGKKVVGIGVDGADELARMRAEAGFPIRLSQWDVREVMRDGEPGIQAMVCMRDVASGQEAPAFCFYPHWMDVERTERDPAGAVVRTWTERVRDRHNDRKAFGVAKRNSILQLAPAESKAALIARRKELHERNKGKLAERADARRQFDRAERKANQPRAAVDPDPYAAEERAAMAAVKPQAPAAEAPVCPKCQGPMWDNRATKTNPRQPDFKCKDKQGCDGVIWPPKDGELPLGGGQAAPRTRGRDALREG